MVWIFVEKYYRNSIDNTDKNEPRTYVVEDSFSSPYSQFLNEQ